eukprot:TRINITY_DN25535_c0_g1_i1.p1 TRINITY_DN25535_c0_g1~~TRINITY_DN25535_c0_g1_i1.p1  ORF type:complete len:294 (-),score=102.87 TRINITY_DN25535_c0_g1_i1:267-1148(-)
MGNWMSSDSCGLCERNGTPVAGAPQLKCTLPKKYTYFPLATPIGLPSQVLLEMSEQAYEGVSVPMEEWAKIKETTVTGKLPFADMKDGTVMVESAAIARVIAAATGRLGHGKDYMISEMLAGMNSDLGNMVGGVAPTKFTVADFDAAKKKAFEEKKGKIMEHLDKYVQYLVVLQKQQEEKEVEKKEEAADGKEAAADASAAKDGEKPKEAAEEKPAAAEEKTVPDRFTEGGLTYGEIDLFCKLHCYSTGALPELTTGKLAAFYKRIKENSQVKKVLDGESKFGKLESYFVPLP